MPQLNVALVPAPDQVVVRLTGDADLFTAPLITDALVQAATLGTRQVVVDVAAARFWDCSRLHALAGFTADLATAGRACRIVGATRAARRLLAAASLTDRLDLDGPLNVVADAPPARRTGNQVVDGPRPAAAEIPPQGRTDHLVAAGTPAVLP